MHSFIMFYLGPSSKHVMHNSRICRYLLCLSTLMSFYAVNQYESAVSVCCCGRDLASPIFLRPRSKGPIIVILV